MPAKEALHMLEEGVGIHNQSSNQSNNQKDLPRKRCICWKSVLVHSLAGKHLSPLAWQHTVHLLPDKYHFRCRFFLLFFFFFFSKGKYLWVIEFVTGGQEQDWRPRRLHCLLLLPPLACRTLVPIRAITYINISDISNIEDQIYQTYQIQKIFGWYYHNSDQIQIWQKVILTDTQSPHDAVQEGRRCCKKCVNKLYFGLSKSYLNLNRDAGAAKSLSTNSLWSKV